MLICIYLHHLYAIYFVFKAETAYLAAGGSNNSVKDLTQRNL